MNFNEKELDQWLFDALEGNLSESENAQLEAWLAENPDFETEAEAWSQTKYTAKPITFEPKNALYRKQKQRWPWIAAASVLLLGVSLLFINSGTPESNLVASNTKSKKSSSKLVASNSKTTFNNTKKFNLSSSTQGSVNQANFYHFDQGSIHQSLLSHINQGSIPHSNLSHSDQISTNLPFTNPTSTNFIETSSFQASSNPSALISSSEKLHLTSSTPLQEWELIQPLMPKNIRVSWHAFQAAYVAETNTEESKNRQLDLNLLTKIDRFVDKEIGLTNNQSYDLLLPGKSNIDASISSVGTLSQSRFQSMSSIRSQTNLEQMQMQQQFSFDTYARSLRSGLGIQSAYRQFANAAATDYEMALIAAPKLMLTRNIILEPSFRLKLGARYADQEKLQGIQFLELGAHDVRAVNMDSTSELGRRIFYKDLDFGFGIQTPIFFINAQLDNAFRHFDYTFGTASQNGSDRALQNWTISFGTQYASRNEKMRLSPYLIYTKTGNYESYYTGFQLNFKSFQLGASIGSAQQYQLSSGYVGKNFALLLQSCRQQLLSLNTPSFNHQLTFRIYSQPSRKARRYISL
ncbi:MAG: hypothetical protein RLZZ65_995 [Bacteroidota bacterium]|jgi:hypothetical protein